MSEEQRRGRRGGVETSIRTAAIWESVLALAQERHELVGRPLRVVDLGGGTGGVAVPLAVRGHHVTVVDPSLDALASLERRAGEVGVADRVQALQGDAATLAEVYTGEPADLVCCHGVLEVVDDPAATIAAAGAVLDEGGALSLVVAQRLAVVLARALAGRFAQAQEALTSPDGRWGSADPLPRRFDADQVRALVERSGLVVENVHGVRIFADLVPAAFLDSEHDRAALLDLERHIQDHPDHALLGNLGAAMHLTARRVAGAGGAGGSGGDHD